MAQDSNYLPHIFYKFKEQMLHTLAIPAFAFLFLILYKPFNLHEVLELKHGGFAFNVTIISVILLLVLLITRLVLWGLRNTVKLSRRTYVFWCFGEILISTLFISMYIALMSGGALPYMDLIPIVMVESFAVEFFPYVIISLILETDIVSKYTEIKEENPKLRFYDEKHNLKFVIEDNALLYIEAEENYCNIYYAEGQKIKKFMLRNTMKNIENLCESHGVLRCHRSFFVNTGRIKTLRKEREGVNLAELDFPDLNGIPITPKYYDAVSSKL